LLCFDFGVILHEIFKSIHALVGIFSGTDFTQIYVSTFAGYFIFTSVVSFLLPQSFLLSLSSLAVIIPFADIILFDIPNPLENHGQKIKQKIGQKIKLEKIKIHAWEHQWPQEDRLANQRGLRYTLEGY